MGEIIGGLKQLRKIKTIPSQAASIVHDVVGLSIQAVKHDKELLGTSHGYNLSDINLLRQRILEIGYLFGEFFIKGEYEWQPQSESPRIIDLGGDLGGVSVLYWKHLAPNAKLVLVEANPSTTLVAAENFRRKNLTDVEVINAAVSDHEGSTVLHIHKPHAGYHTGDFIGERSGLDSSLYYSVSIPTIKASTVIGDEKVDLLKIDIEGSEASVLRELASSGKIRLIEEMIVEFHNDPTNPTNSLAEVLDILERADFVIENPHRSGRGLRRRSEIIDLRSISPSDRVLIMFHARRKINSGSRRS